MTVSASPDTSGAAEHASKMEAGTEDREAVLPACITPGAESGPSNTDPGGTTAACAWTVPGTVAHRNPYNVGGKVEAMMMVSGETTDASATTVHGAVRRPPVQKSATGAEEATLTVPGGTTTASATTDHGAVRHPLVQKSASGAEEATHTVPGGTTTASATTAHGTAPRLPQVSAGGRVRHFHTSLGEATASATTAPGIVPHLPKSRAVWMIQACHSASRTASAMGPLLEMLQAWLHAPGLSQSAMILSPASHPNQPVALRWNPCSASVTALHWMAAKSRLMSPSRAQPAKDCWSLVAASALPGGPTTSLTTVLTAPVRHSVRTVAVIEVKHHLHDSTVISRKPRSTLQAGRC